MGQIYRSPTVDDRVLWDLHLSGYPLSSVLAADELGLFVVLAEAPADAAGLAARMGLSERGVNALLPMLAALGLLAVRDGVYGVTAATRNFLLPDSEYYWGPVLQVMRRAPPADSAIVAALRPKAKVDNETTRAWEGGAVSEEIAGLIARYMHSHSLAAAVGVARGGGLEGVRRLLDVGGGSGCYSIALSQALPEIRCTVLEIEGMCRIVDTYIAEAGADRVDTLARDMFRDPWPTGYDGLFFSNIFHDWDFEVCRGLAARAFEALPSGGRIFLHEALLNDGRDGPPTLAAFSIQMLVSNRGQQFTFSDLEGILTQAGFVDVGAVSTHAYYSVVSARKP